MNFFSATLSGVSKGNSQYDKPFVHDVDLETFELKVLRKNSATIRWQVSRHQTSYSQPAMHCQPLRNALSTTCLMTPRGSAHIGSLVSGSRKETRKNGVLFSQGIRRNVERSMEAKTSRYPFARFEMSSSSEYTAS